MDWDKKISAKEHSFKFFMQGMRALWNLMEDKKIEMLWIIFGIMVLKILENVFPLILKLIIDEIPMVAASGLFGRLAGLSCLLYAVSFIANFGHKFIVERKFLVLLIYLENLWPRRVQEKLLNLSIEYHEKENIGKKIAKIEKGCDRLIDIVARLRWGVLPNLFYLMFNVVFIMFLDWRLGLIFLTPFIPASWTVLKGWQKYADEWEKWDVLKEQACGVFVQSISNVRTVQNYVQELQEQNQFKSVRKKMEEVDVIGSTGMQKYFFIMNLIMKTFFVITIFAGVWLILKNECTVGTLVFIIATGNVTNQNLWNIVHEYTEINRRLFSVLRMRDLLNEKSIIVDHKAIVPEQVKGRIEFKNVSFKYSKKKEEVLRNFDLLVKPRQLVALVGKTGEGKSTTLALFGRIYDVCSGQICLDGIDIRDLDLKWYRKLFAYVQQEVEIFDASIAENVRYSYPDASEEQICQALRAAYLNEVLENNCRFPEGIYTQVGERGVRLSGGEKQRVGIARAYLAIARGAKYLILDEATSHLDSQAEQAIQLMIEKMRKTHKITIIACAHRLSTIQKADQICVINDGCIAEKGCHNRLLNGNGLYAELVKLQNLGEIRE